jgi:hypothetical protein
VKSNRFWSKQQEGKKANQTRLSKAHDPPATMKFMPEHHKQGYSTNLANNVTLLR